MERIIDIAFGSSLYWFILDNAEILMVMTVLVWIRAAAIQLHQVFSEGED